MTERQGRLVSKIQGYEGKDQKTSQSQSSVCSWVPRRESEASKRWEESWWWVTQGAPLQDNDRTVIIDNDDMWWRALPSNFTGNDQGKIHVSTHSAVGGTGKERKGERNPLPLPYHHAYAIRSEDNPKQEKQRDVSLCRRQAGHFWAECVVARQSPCPGGCLGLLLEGQAFLSLSRSLQESQISAGCCQQWS